MKNIIIFFAGFFSAIILISVGVAVTYTHNPEEEIKEQITMLNEPQETFETNVLTVKEALEDGSAIVYEESRSTKMLFLAKDKSAFFDNQEIKVPQGKCVRQIGVFKHYFETLPIVDFFDKE